MRPFKRTLSGRFSILRSSSEMITLLFYCGHRGGRLHKRHAPVPNGVSQGRSSRGLILVDCGQEPEWQQDVASCVSTCLVPAEV